MDNTEAPQVETVEVENTQPEADTQGESTAPEGDAGEPAHEEEEAFRPWELAPKAEEEGDGPKIPYSRFKEVNEERKAYQQQLAQYEQELQQYRQRAEQVAQVKAPSEIKMEDYNTVEEYLAARDEAVQAAAVARVEQAFIQRETARIVEQRNQEMAQRFADNVEKHAAANPDVKRAVDWLDSVADRLHPAVAREFLQDENAALLIHKVVTDKALLRQVFTGNPEDTIRNLHKISAKLEGAEAPVYKAPPPRPTTGVPQTVRAAAKSPTKDPSKMSHAEYRKWRGFDK